MPLQRFVSREPRSADGWLELGVAHQALERWDDARAAYARCRELDPHSSAAWCNLGATFQHERRYPEAEEAYRAALRLAPDSPAILNNLAIALHAQKNWDGALAVLERLLEVAPDHLDGLDTLASTLTAKSDFTRAEAALRRALALAPRRAEAHANLANLLLTVGKAHDSLAAYATAIELNPALTTAQYNESIARLLTGDLAGGWPRYELRLEKRPRAERERFSAPRWRGDFPLHGRTILVHAEQGLGDTLQFIRYVPLLAAAGATVHVEVQRPLLSLARSIAGAASVIARGDPLPAFDCHCPMLSLPLGFGTTLGTIPSAPSYLSAAPEKVALWEERLRTRAPHRIGIVWSGNPLHENDHNRSIALASFQRLFAVAGVQFFNLQKNVSAADAALLAAHPNVTTLAPQLGDFSDTAAAVMPLDLVISVDTSVAHLAGALGKPVWVLLPYAPDWRWLLERTDNPWYPTATLFRQPQPGEWSTPLAQVAARLA